MLYHLSQYLQSHWDVPGAGLFHYLTFRSMAAIIVALLIGTIFGRGVINRLARLQVTTKRSRTVGLRGRPEQNEKLKTPTMGGVIILGAILIPILLFGDLTNVYTLIMIATTVWFGFFGFLDDYIKVFRGGKKVRTSINTELFLAYSESFCGGEAIADYTAFLAHARRFKEQATVNAREFGEFIDYLKKLRENTPSEQPIEFEALVAHVGLFQTNKVGLNGWVKVAAQVGFGIFVGSMMCFNQNIVVADQITHNVSVTEGGTVQNTYTYTAEHSTQTTIPFVKNNEFNYKWIASWAGEWQNIVTWILYILIAILIITFISNCANLTDGLDGLSTGISTIVVLVLGIFAYVSGSIVYAPYLNIMYIPGSGELTVFAAAFVGALIGFLWYNCNPAQIFMGDVGSLAIGGIIAVFTLLIRKEFLLPLLCGVFIVEGISVVLQVGWRRYTEWRYGERRRLFRMAPLHHHYQKKNMAETKIVVRFWIIQILLAAMTLAILKIR